MRNRSRSTSPRKQQPRDVAASLASEHADAVSGASCIDAASADALTVAAPAFWRALLVDLAFWVVMYAGRTYARDPATGAAPSHVAIAHYFAVLTVTDVGCFFLCPPSRRHWYYPFRIAGALQVAGALYQFAHNGNDVDGALWWTVLRLLACGVRIVDAVVASVQAGLLSLEWPALRPPAAAAAGEPVPVGPATQRWLALATYCATAPGPVTFELMTALVFISLPAVASSTHFHMGEPRLDAPLAGFQAGDALNAFVKVFVIEKLIGGATKAAVRRRAWIHLMLAASLLVQWPLYPEIIRRAPRAYAHVVAEFGCLVNAGLRLWYAFALPQ